MRSRCRKRDQHGGIFEQRDIAYVHFANELGIGRDCLERYVVVLQPVTELPGGRPGHLRLDRIDVRGRARRLESVGQHRLDGEPTHRHILDGRPNRLLVGFVRDQFSDDRMTADVGGDANTAPAAMNAKPNAISIQRFVSSLSRVLVSKITLLGSSSVYMPGAVESVARRLFLKRRMAALGEWLPLKQPYRLIFRFFAERG